MNAISILPVFAIIAFGVPASASAQTPPATKSYVYPSKGQTAQQQQADESQCHSWAIQQSGYNPANPPTAAKAQPAPVTGSGARVRGATAGAAIGAIGGNNVGDAALKGAVAGGISRRARNREAAAQQNNAAAAQQQSGLAGYQHARKACLEGRGYTVN